MAVGPKAIQATVDITGAEPASYDQDGKDGNARDLGSLEEEIGLTAARIRATEQTVDADGEKGPVVCARSSVCPRPSPRREAGGGG